MIRSPFLAHKERFDVVGSTNDVVRGWLADGVPEVCLAVADEQSAGRGREGRTWTAPRGHALLASLGFRPTWLEPGKVWRLPAIVSLAMAEAGEFVAGLAPGAIRLKWPNDLVIESDGGVRKLAGVLGETDGLGTDDPRAVIGIGINTDWPADEFPTDLAPTMTSLGAAGSRRIFDDELLEVFLASLEHRIDALRAGRFDAVEYRDRQLTDGRLVRLTSHDGSAEVVRALRVAPDTGALVVGSADVGAPAVDRHVFSGEIHHLRLEPGV
jgi:BirA family transcriptional regulator, biotin operon repressor / biotin---[acetyl-CoA-carboxylase] ligase